jgi:hypothetical protein
MEKSEIDDFRQRFRLALVERLVLRTAFLAPVLSRGLSSQESRQTLVGWLSTNSDVADKAFGSQFRDPAKAALYADEVKEVTDEMAAFVKRIADEWDQAFG